MLKNNNLPVFGAAILLALPQVMLADESSESRPSYVQAEDEDTGSPVPKLSPEDVKTVVPAQSAGPYRLSTAAGLNSQSRFQVNGFVSAGVARSTSSRDYRIPGHGNVGDNYNFNALSLLGLQITANLTKQMSVVAQVVANGDSTNGNTAYSVNLDYGLLRYRFNDRYQVRAGRFQLPVFLYSATREIGYTYPWVTLPNEVYRIVPFDSMNGVDSIVQYAIGKSGWNVSMHPYVGSGRSKFDSYNSSLTSDAISVPTSTFEENSLIGMVAEVSNQHLTLRGTYAHLKLTAKTDILGNNGFTNQTLVDNQSDSFYSVGTKVDYPHIKFAAEFAHRNTPAPLAALSGVYGMFGYQFGQWLPNFTYARLWTTNSSALKSANSGSTNPTELAQKQESYTAGLAYYLNRNVAFKLSAADVRPLGGTSGLFDTVEPSRLKRNNWLYMVGVDAIF